jgi:hypothetical protein
VKSITITYTILALNAYNLLPHRIPKILALALTIVEHQHKLFHLPFQAKRSEKKKKYRGECFKEKKFRFCFRSKFQLPAATALFKSFTSKQSKKQLKKP